MSLQFGGWLVASGKSCRDVIIVETMNCGHNELRTHPKIAGQDFLRSFAFVRSVEMMEIIVFQTQDDAQQPGDTQHNLKKPLSLRNTLPNKTGPASPLPQSPPPSQLPPPSPPPSLGLQIPLKQARKSPSFWVPWAPPHQPTEPPPPPPPQPPSPLSPSPARTLSA